MSRPTAGPQVSRPAAATLQSRWLRAPVWWAAFGAVCVVFQTVVFAQWAAAGNAHAYPSGGLQMAPGMRMATGVEQVVAVAGCVLLAAIAWIDTRSAGRVTLSAALTAGYFLAFWTDPWSGTFRHAVSANRYGLNV